VDWAASVRAPENPILENLAHPFIPAVKKVTTSAKEKKKKHVP
jgi:hypothetical protein